METDWCTCGQKVYDPNAFYCSSECANNENSSVKQSMNSSLNTPPPTPPLNLHFSITITSNFYKANSNAKVMSPPPSADSSYTDNVLSSFTIDQNFNDHVYNYRNHGKEDIVDDEYYPPYYSTSNPIDIPSSRTKVADDPAEESINKGTFGEDKSFF